MHLFHACPCSVSTHSALSRFVLLRLPSSSTVFPYTTLFRSSRPHRPRRARIGSLSGRVRRCPRRPARDPAEVYRPDAGERDRKSTRLNSSHTVISYAVFCLKKKKRFSTLTLKVL